MSDGQMFGKEGEVVTPSVLADLCGKGNIKTAFAFIPESCLGGEFTVEEFISVIKAAVEAVE
jgi:hypothetical protein